MLDTWEKYFAVPVNDEYAETLIVDWLTLLISICKLKLLSSRQRCHSNLTHLDPFSGLPALQGSQASAALSHQRKHLSFLVNSTHHTSLDLNQHMLYVITQQVIKAYGRAPFASPSGIEFQVTFCRDDMFTHSKVFIF